MKVANDGLRKEVDSYKQVMTACEDRAKFAEIAYDILTNSIDIIG